MQLRSLPQLPLPASDACCVPVWCMYPNARFPGSVRAVRVLTVPKLLWGTVLVPPVAGSPPLQTGGCALHAAASSGHTDIVKALLSTGKVSMDERSDVRSLACSTHSRLLHSTVVIVK